MTAFALLCTGYLEGGVRMHTAISGGFLPPTLRGTVSNLLTSNADWWPTLSWLAGVDPCTLAVTRTPDRACA